MSSPEQKPLPEIEIQKRIREGNRRRVEAKKGTVRRLFGNCSKILAATCFMAVALSVSVGGRLKESFHGDSRIDLVEIFGGAAEVSLHFSRKGWNVSEPVDILYGVDLRERESRGIWFWIG